MVSLSLIITFRAVRGYLWASIAIRMRKKAEMSGREKNGLLREGQEGREKGEITARRARNKHKV